MRIGLFGCGRIGRVHAASLAANPRTELAVAYDPFEAAAGEVVAQHGGIASTDPQVILDDETIDAVVIASPTPTHVELLTRAVRAGKAVLCEKPIDLDLARVDACAAELDGVDATVMVGFNRRFDPSMRAVWDRVTAGEIGTLEQLSIVSRDPSPPPLSYVTESGGLFRDMTIHDFDMARFFLGEVVEVSATGANLVDPAIARAGDIDSAVVVLRGRTGALATITNSRRCAFGYDQRLEAFGSDGMLSVANQLPNSVRFSGSGLTEAAEPYLNFFLDRYTAAYRAELDHLLDRMEDGAPPSPGFADGRAALVLADAALESLRSGRAVPVAA
jgi:myo-inositol 2-dehydrogenase / D-chiro-inositol 1-dehydrogenase